jgi:sulfoxide reductase heme-binding subunit YedZ
VFYKISKILAHIAGWLPLGYLVYAANNRLLGADPQEEMLHQLGLWTLIFLLIGLSITPLNRIFKFPILIRYRRMVGLYAFFYLLLHLTVFFVFYLELSINYLWDEIIERPYITVGMLATLMLLPLVATSTKKMQRRLGRNWKKLHQLVYLIAILGITHFIWQSKSDLNEPFLYLIWLVFVLGYRLYRVKFKH